MSRRSQGRESSGHSPEAVAQLLDVVGSDRVETALTNMEQVLAELRADAAKVAEARKELSAIPAPVLREAMRLRAARFGQVR